MTIWNEGDLKKYIPKKAFDMKTVSNASEVYKILESLARELLERVSKEVLEDFLRDYIEKQVYGVNSPTVYKNDGVKFKDIWDFSQVQKLSNSLQTEMKGDWSLLESIDDLFIHSSYTPFGKDSRPFLERVLNRSGKTSHPWSRDSKPYWDNFKREYVQGGRLQRVIDKHAKSLGFANIGGFTSVNIRE
jgi:hypothetical protein